MCSLAPGKGGNDRIGGVQYILVVEVVRLGTYALEPSSYMTPRSLHLGGSEGTFSENNELNAMSSVLMRQWLQFTEREKLVRVLMLPLREGDLHAPLVVLTDRSLQASLWCHDGA